MVGRSEAVVRFADGRGRWAREVSGFTPGGGGGEDAGAWPDDGWDGPGSEPAAGWPDPVGGDAGPVEAFPGEADPPADPLDGEPEPATPVVAEVFVYEWATEADGRVCPSCGPLDGTRWEDDDGPLPPLHVGCRCKRRLVAVERRTVRK